MGFSLAACLLIAVTQAPEPTREERPRFVRAHSLRQHWPAELAVTAAGFGAWVATETVFKKDLAPARCRWCDSGPAGLNALDAAGRALRTSGSAQGGVDLVSGLVAFGFVPATLAASDTLLATHHNSLDAVPFDLLFIAEAALASTALNQATKFLVGRERPFVHVLPPEKKGQTRDPADNNLSFYSGHTSLAFSVTFAAYSVAKLRGYRDPWFVLAMGLPPATVVPLLRMGADRHYLTDVLVGAAAGSAIGAATPFLLHPRVDGDGSRDRPISWRLLPHPGGLSVAGDF